MLSQDLRSREVIACVAAIPTPEKTNLNEILRLNDNYNVAVGESEGTFKEFTVGLVLVNVNINCRCG